MKNTKPNPPCVRCKSLTKFVVSLLNPDNDQIVHLFECECGEKSWLREANAGFKPTNWLSR